MTVVALLYRPQIIKPDELDPHMWRANLTELCEDDDAMLPAMARQVVNWEIGSPIGPFGEEIPCESGYGFFDFRKDVCLGCQVGRDCIARTMGMSPTAIGLIAKKRGGTRKKASGPTKPRKKKVVYNPNPFSPVARSTDYTLFNELLEVATSNPEYVRKRKVVEVIESDIWIDKSVFGEEIRELCLLLDISEVVEADDVDIEVLNLWRDIYSHSVDGVDNVLSVKFSPSTVRKTIKLIKSGKHKLTAEE